MNSRSRGKRGGTRIREDEVAEKKMDNEDEMEG